MRRAARLDAFQPIVRDLFRSHGCEWEDFGGKFDALVAPPIWMPIEHRRSHMGLVEVKSGLKARTKSATAKRQSDFALRFPVWCVSTLDEAMVCIKWLKGDS